MDSALESIDVVFAYENKFGVRCCIYRDAVSALVKGNSMWFNDTSSPKIA